MNKQDFLNPKSMLTPGIAGGTVMLITNALINQFDWSGPIVALILSFLVGALVFLAGSVPLLKRVIYYVLNSLIIFAMATGSASVGNKAEVAVTKPPNTRAAVSATPVAASSTRVAASPTPSAPQAGMDLQSAFVANKVEKAVRKPPNTKMAAVPTPSVTQASRVFPSGTTNRAVLTNAEAVRLTNSSEVPTSKKLFFKKW